VTFSAKTAFKRQAFAVNAMIINIEIKHLLANVKNTLSKNQLQRNVRVIFKTIIFSLENLPYH
jgi:hypothetical protein